MIVKAAVEQLAKVHARKVVKAVGQIVKVPQEQPELHAVIVQLLAVDLACHNQRVLHNVRIVVLIVNQDVSHAQPFAMEDAKVNAKEHALDVLVLVGRNVKAAVGRIVMDHVAHAILDVVVIVKLIVETHAAEAAEALAPNYAQIIVKLLAEQRVKALAKIVAKQLAMILAIHKQPQVAMVISIQRLVMDVLLVVIHIAQVVKEIVLD